MKTGKRIQALDLLRGIALICIVFFHTSVYNFANIHKIDFAHPPVLIVLISFLILWGGLIILYSGFVNTLMLARRIGGTDEFRPFGFLIVAGLIYVAVHYLLNMVLGRWSVDFVNNQPDFTAVAASVRSGSLSFPGPAKMFEGSSLSTIALNLIVLSLINYSLMRKGGINKELRNYSILLAGGFLIMILSYARIGLYPGFQEAIRENHTFIAVAGSFLLANPYPMLPYLGYGLFGSAAAIMLFHRRKKLVIRLLIPVGILFLCYGVIGAMQHEKTISTPDYFWYFKTQFELGVFLLVLAWVILSEQAKSHTTLKLPLIRWFSRLSLTIYLLETPVSELLGELGHVMIPGWNQTINGCLVFGAINVLIWAVILYFWRKIDFRYSVEYFWVQGFKGLGKHSGKLDDLK